VIAGALATVVLVVSASDALAQGVRADNMADACRAIAAPQMGRQAYASTYNNGICRGLFSVVDEVIETDLFVFDPPDQPLARICPIARDWSQSMQDRNWIEAMITVFVRYFDALPVDRRGEAFLGIALESLEDAFPCRVTAGQIEP
jgi:hypothetical protein